MLLGVGWNFMFVGGTTLLATAHDPHERVRVQATNDFIVFGTVAFPRSPPARSRRPAAGPR